MNDIHITIFFIILATKKCFRYINKQKLGIHIVIYTDICNTLTKTLPDNEITLFLKFKIFHSKEDLVYLVK